MAKKRTRPGNLLNKQASAKQAAKKKRQKAPDARTLRFKNAALEDSIDSQAHVLYATNNSPSRQFEAIPSATTDRELAAIMGSL
ncbi:hypothetical protein E1B28_010112 [Marasmius oreades]|uniref:Uncharacterized protein n=1 Tax=Marasmius oreades TaxID=181124 RepID=A0A9P7URG2_9AGAR|nr:uncharacterized protein E1B28_010112 [Marasmius oreades]KAG7091055.1 hypothetical protein E1B28_010112 [Marasmius oreades]